MVENHIWLIGGTQESAELARELAQRRISYVVSVTTESARSLYPDVTLGIVWVDRLTTESLPQFLQQYNIGAVLDASHPFAVEISRVAIATCAQWRIPYLRYERPVHEGKGRGQKAEGELTFPSFDALLTSNVLVGQRALLTTGYRSLELFKSWQEQAVLFTRILPSVTALEAAIAAGFTPDRIIALRPPISADLERALWQQWQINMVVTKASGTAGGENVKRQVAAELGVQLVIIARPELTYPQQTSDLAVALTFCQQLDAV